MTEYDGAVLETLGPSCTRRGPLTIRTVVKGLITEFRILIPQFRALITLLITRGPHLVATICAHCPQKNEA